MNEQYLILCSRSICVFIYLCDFVCLRMRSSFDFREAKQLIGPLLLEAVQGKRATLGDTHPDLLTSINNYNELLQDQRKFSEAVTLLRGVLRRIREDNPEVCVVLFKLGATLGVQGKCGKALLYYCRAYNAQCPTVGVGHPDTIRWKKIAGHQKPEKCVLVASLVFVVGVLLATSRRRIRQLLGSRRVL